jgi:hypothetical protein
MTIYSHKFSGVLPAGDIFAFGFHDSNGVGLAAAHTNAANWLTAFMADMAGQYNTGLEFTAVTTYQLDVVAPYRTVAVKVDNVASSGSSILNSLPQDLAEVCSLRTSDPSRKGRGRMYLPALDLSSCDSVGQIDPTTRANLVTALTDAFTSCNSGGTVPVVFSRTTGLAQTIVNFSVGSIFDRQSRRINKVNTIRSVHAMP